MPAPHHQVLVLAVALAGATAGCVSHTGGNDPGLAAANRAIRLLSSEVAAWSSENACFSCHNNGDAARALMVAGRWGFSTSGSLVDTLDWLSGPSIWDDNKGDPGFSDQKLANLQFTLALATAVGTGLLEVDLFREAVRRVARDQAADGSWAIDPHNAAGSPATYGSALATALAIQVMRSAPDEFGEATRRATNWLTREPVRAVSGAAALLHANIVARKAEALDYLHRAQNDDGGWGPYPHAPSEAFDTALALLALAKEESKTSAAATFRGRQFLIGWQNPDGSWPASTRPPGGESYAQQMSTTGWATLALLATRPGELPLEVNAPRIPVSPIH